MNTKIQPLVEDVGNVVPGVFLKSTVFKRWLVERNLDEVWAHLFKEVKSNRSFFAVGYDHEADDSKNALEYLLNIFFEQRREKLPTFLLDFLSFYAYQETVYIDVTDIKKDLLAAGFSEEDVAVLDGVTIPEQIEEKIDANRAQRIPMFTLSGYRFFTMVKGTAKHVVSGTLS